MMSANRRTRRPLAAGNLEAAKAAARRYATGAEGLAPTTLRLDRFGLQDFVQWLDINGIDPGDDFDDALIAVYVEDRHRAGVPPSRVGHALTALGRQIAPEVLAPGKTLHRNHLRRVGQTQNRRGQAPVYPEETLALISEELGAVTDRAMINHAAFVLAAAVPWPGRSRRLLNGSHLDDRGDVLVVHPPDGCDVQPVIVGVSTDILLCPVSAARTLKQLRPEQLFVGDPFQHYVLPHRPVDLELHLSVERRSAGHIAAVSQIAHRVAWPIRIARRNRAEFNFSYSTAIRDSGRRRVRVDHLERQPVGTWLVHQPHSKWNQRGDPDDFVLEHRGDALDLVAITEYPADSITEIPQF